MMRALEKILILFFFCAFTQTATAQSELNQLSLPKLHQFTEKNPEEGYAELIRRREAAIAKEDIQEQYEVAKYLARYGYLISNNSLAEQYKQEVARLAESLDDIEFDKSYHSFLIALAIADKQGGQAIKYLREISSRVFKSRDTSWMITYHCQSARAYAANDDDAVAMKHLLHAELLNETYQDEALQAAIHTAHAGVYWEQKNHQLAYEKDLLAMQYYEKVNSYRNLLPVYTNLMTKAAALGKKNEALEFARKYEKLRKEFGTNLGFFTNELNRIFFYIELKEFDKAIEQAASTIQLAKRMNRDSSHAIYLMGVAYRGKEQWDLAAQYIEKAFDIGKSMHHHGKCSFYSHALYQTYYWHFKYAPALEWYRTHISYRDSVYNEKKIKEIAVYESKLETLEQRRKVEELEAKVEIDRQQMRVLWVSIILGSLLTISLIYAQSQRANKEKARHAGLLLKSRLEKEQLEQQLEFKRREVTTQLIHMAHKNTLLKEIQEEITQLETPQNTQSVSKLNRIINRHVNDTDDWDYFLNSFKSVHSSFFKELQSMAENLTSNDIRLASLLKMNMSSKEIATMLNISNEGVKKARYRLRKKIQLPGEHNLQDFLLQI